MSVKIKALIHTRCALPIHADTAAQLCVPKCPCSGPRKIVEKKQPLFQQPTVQQCTRLGVIALSALQSQRRKSAATVNPYRLEAALTRTRPHLDDPDAYAAFVLRQSPRVTQQV